MVLDSQMASEHNQISDYFLTRLCPRIIIVLNICIIWMINRIIQKRHIIPEEIQNKIMYCSFVHSKKLTDITRHAPCRVLIAPIYQAPVRIYHLYFVWMFLGALPSNTINKYWIASF